MPNIEIYGYLPILGSKSFRDTNPQITALMDRIEKIIQEMGIGEEAVMTLIPSTVHSCGREGKMMPFVRVCSSSEEEIRGIVKALKKEKIGIDVETLLLGGFISADEMKR